MEDNVSLEIEILKRNILLVLQQTNLPISVVYYVISDITKELGEKYQDYSQKIIEEYNKSLEHEQEKEKINKEMHEKIKNDKNIKIEDYKGE